MIFGINPRHLVPERLAGRVNTLVQLVTKDLPREIEHTIQVAREREFNRHDEEIKMWDLTQRAASLRDRAVLRLDRWISVNDNHATDIGVAPAFQLRPTDTEWIIVESGKSEALQTFTKKPQAIKAAKAFARAKKATLDVFTKHGSLQDSYSFV